MVLCRSGTKRWGSYGLAPPLCKAQRWGLSPQGESFCPEFVFAFSFQKHPKLSLEVLFCFSMQIWMRCSCNCKYDVCAQSARRAGVRLNPCFNEKVVSQAGLGLRQLWRSQGGFILLGCFLTNCSNFAVPKTEPVSRSRNRGRFPALSKLYAPEEVL